MSESGRSGSAPEGPGEYLPPGQNRPGPGSGRYPGSGGQYPGGSPYPPGQYPPGQYPGGSPYPPGANGGQPPNGGAYPPGYFPPGTYGNGSNNPGGPGGGAPPRRPAGTRMPRNQWVVPLAIVAGAILVALVRSHRISTPEIIIFCAMVPSIILHEIAHGWVALLFGDDTAKRAGRLTLNPIAHIDPVGTIIVPAIMAINGIGFFGWAKPVPVNVSKLRSPRNHGVLVSLAGPVTNMVLAAMCCGLFVAIDGATAQSGARFTLAEILFYAGLVNVLLAIFNLIPIPPLDGSVLIERMLPRSWWPGYLRFRRYTMPLILILVILNFYMNPGPITWLFGHVESWWANLLNV